MLKVTPLDAPLGAEVSGLVPARLGPEEAGLLNEAFLEHHLLVVRDQKISDAELVEFGKAFGRIEKARQISPLSGRDDIMVISNIREDGKPLGQLPDGEMSFHIDRLHQKTPCKAAALLAIEIPKEGGDTCFSNNIRAYEALDDRTKAKLEGLTALHTFTYGATDRGQKTDAELGPHCIHPLVRRIPETGKKSLFLCRLMTDRINDLSPGESRALIDELCDQIEQPQFIYTHKWRVGDILVWDNRCTCHARTDFSESERRLMKRVTIGDDVAPLA
jgi:taurine dioxygenase